MEYIDVKEPVFSNEAGTMIDCVVVIAEDNEINFTASGGDYTEYGVEIYNRCVAGDFGAVSSYIEPLAVIPQVVTMRQARLALLSSGLLASVDAAIAGLSEPQKSAALIEWEYSQTVERSRPFVITLGALLGLSDIELDDLFILASTL